MAAAAICQQEMLKLAQQVWYWISKGLESLTLWSTYYIDAPHPSNQLMIHSGNIHKAHMPSGMVATFTLHNSA